MLNIVFQLVGAAIAIFLIWLIWPVTNYRVARKWVRTSRGARYKHWLHYRHIKREITATTIAMNAVNSSTFTPEDLKQLNKLFGKLGQPPAEAILPDAESRFDETIMNDLKAPGQHHQQKRSYVLETKAIGVIWSRDVLKKADVVACTPDHLMIQRLAASGVSEPTIVQTFLDHLRQNNEPTVDFELEPSLLNGFIQANMLQKNAESLFACLSKSHPESDFSTIHPRANDWYNADTMTPRGGQIAGQKCRVVEVIHPGLIRKHNKGWSIKALVKIENQNRN